MNAEWNESLSGFSLSLLAIDALRLKTTSKSREHLEKESDDFERNMTPHPIDPKQITFLTNETLKNQVNDSFPHRR